MREARLAWAAIAAIAIGCGAMQPQNGTVTGVVHGVKHYDSTRLGPPLEDERSVLSIPTPEISLRGPRRTQTGSSPFPWRRESTRYGAENMPNTSR